MLRTIRMLRARVPDELKAVEMSARLQNPGTESGVVLSAIGRRTTLSLRAASAPCGGQSVEP